MSGIANLFTQTVSLETYLGSGAFGDDFAAAVDVPCYVEDSIKEVRNRAGEQVVSMARLFASLQNAPAIPPVAGQFSVGSRVAVGGRSAFVLSTARLDGAGPSRVHHVLVHLT